MGQAAQTADDEIRTELIDGKIVMMSPRPCVDHTRAGGRIYRIFDEALEGKQCEAFPDGVDVFLDEKNRFVPDAMIVCNPKQIKPDRIVGAPTLVVEVLSPSTAMRDRTSKMRAYAKAGVQEYWLVDVIGCHIEVYRPQDGRFELTRIYQYYSPEELRAYAEEDEAHRLSDEEAEQTIHVDLCGGFDVELGVVFERVRGTAL